MLGQAQAGAMASPEVLDGVSYPWDTEPERLLTGTAPSFLSLPSLQDFSHPKQGLSAVLAVPLRSFGESLGRHLPPT